MYRINDENGIMHVKICELYPPKVLAAEAAFFAFKTFKRSDKFTLFLEIISDDLHAIHGQ